MNSHVHISIEPFLSLSDAERIQKIKSEKWIGYSKSKIILNKLEDLLQHPKTIRMPNLLLVGDTNNGKTILINKFYNDHRPNVVDNAEKITSDVIYVQAPPKPDERRFYNSILDLLFVPYRFNDRVEKKQQQIIQIMRRLGVKMLIIDEIHHVLAGNAMAQRTFLNVIKYMANELQIVIVGVGIKDAFNVINSDPQLANRFEPMVLPRWKMNEEYLRLLASFEYILPLQKPSLLHENSIAMQLLSMSEGSIGEISTIIKKAAILAIENKTEKITKEILSSIDYISPSDRKQQINLVG
jgi:hypothetical protein